MVLTTGHIIGIVSGLLLITAVGIYSGKKVKSEKDFAVGGRQASARLISGALMGTLVSGAATVGTAQLAFQFGFSAWWFTLGGGIALAVLGVFMARSFWESKVETLPQYLAKTYSPAIGPISSYLYFYRHLFQHDGPDTRFYSPYDLDVFIASYGGCQHRPAPDIGVRFFRRRLGSGYGGHDKVNVTLYFQHHMRRHSILPCGRLDRTTEPLSKSLSMVVLVWTWF